MTRRDSGQAAVEFAIVLPVVALLVVGMVWVVAIARDQLAVGLAAREAARAAAVSAAPEAAAVTAAEAATSLRPLDVSASAGDRSVTVTVSHASDGMSMLGSVLPSVTVSASVTMAREPP